MRLWRVGENAGISALIRKEEVQSSPTVRRWLTMGQEAPLPSGTLISDVQALEP